MLKSEILENLNAIELYNSGKTLSEIGEIAGCDLTTVKDYLVKNNVQIRPRGVPKQIFKVREIIGNWEVLSEETKGLSSSNKSYGQFCKCTRCGYEAWVDLVKAKNKISNKCQKCKSSKLLNDDGTINYNYVIKEYYFNQHIKKNLERRSKVNTLEFNLTPEYLLELFEKQNRKCAISEINLDIRVIKSDDLLLSLDRIDSNIGYIEGNVQWVHKDINMMKQSYSLDYFKKMCCKVAEQNGYSKCN